LFEQTLVVVLRKHKWVDKYELSYNINLKIMSNTE